MKILKLKKLKLLYVNLIAIAFLLPSFGGAGGGLYAQDPELFNHTWYFEIGELNGTVFFPTDILTAELEFYPNDILIGYPYCEGGLSFENIHENIQFDLNNPTFEILGGSIILVSVCGRDDENELLFMNKHNLIYSDYQNTGIANNPFTYTIATVNNYYQLTIENGVGDWAVYNSVLMSSPSFSQNSFALYPNPVKETLQVSNNSNQMVTATFYDLNGKQLQSHSLETSASTIDVRVLNQGVYFVVFESEGGERVSKKFVKN